MSPMARTYDGRELRFPTGDDFERSLYLESLSTTPDRNNTVATVRTNLIDKGLRRLFPRLFLDGNLILSVHAPQPVVQVICKYSDA